MRICWTLAVFSLLPVAGCAVSPRWDAELFEHPRRKPISQPIRPLMNRANEAGTTGALGLPRNDAELAGPKPALLATRELAVEPDRRDAADSLATRRSDRQTLPVAYERQDEAPPQFGQALQQDEPDLATPDSRLVIPDWIPEIISAEVPTEFGSGLGAGGAAGPEEVDLAEVIRSAVQFYPAIQETIALRQVATGEQLAALGQFDYKLGGSFRSMPVGFYQNHRGGMSAEQPLWGGGSLYAGYRIGRGDTQPWYQERVTNEGGEFAVGFGMPFIKNRTIDDRRAELLKAQQDTLAVEPLIRQQSLEVSLMAADAYWTWLANNAKLTVQRELLQIALNRKSQIERSIALGDRAPADNVDNLRLIATRQTALIIAQRRVESAAIKLSLFLRDPTGNPILLGQSLSLEEFPPIDIGELDSFAADQNFALQNRPELQFLNNQAERLRIELQQAGNIGLPELNWMVDASQDSGAPSSDKRDKSQFELESGLLGYWEPQQRKMLGKQQAVRGKLTQLQFKRQMVSDKVTAELRDARSALNAAARKYEQTKANAELARQTADLFRRSFQAGDVDLIILNIYEEAEASAKSDVIDARADYRFAQALYAVAQGELPQ
jgi:outer membrane protein TolC